MGRSLGWPAARTTKFGTCPHAPAHLGREPEGPEREAFIAGLTAKPPTTFYGSKKYEESRTIEETEGFRYALHETMALWYAHQGTTIYMFTKLPDGATRKFGYDDSGWTTYDRRSAELIKKVYLYEARWKLVMDLGVGDANDAKRSRNWPLDPDGFDELIDTKTFTNGAGARYGAQTLV